ncbi:two-component sensor histidine kinase [Sphingobacteriaceae bacterium]|nr:two-component sensor histidine kinase [Sphingobacteriaceae bacterium]
MKTQSKIALILFSSNVVMMLLFGSAIYYFQNTYSYTDFYKRLETRARVAARYNLQSDRLNAEALKTLREQHLERLSNEKEMIVEISDPESVQRTAVIYQLPQQFLQDILKEGKSTLKERQSFYAGILYTTEGKKYIVIVSADNAYAVRHLTFLRNAIWSSIGIIMLITIAFSLFFSKRIFDPIKQITLRVKQISTESIHLRLDGKDKAYEISELISTFNDLLNRLETSFETQKNFISNASHEFGTPLTSIIGEAEVALIKERSSADYQETLQNILKQAGRLDQITRSLLFLAQTGYEGKKIIFEIIRMDEILWEVKEIINQLNPKNKISIDLNSLPEDPKKLKIKGNRELLNLAIANLFTNACKYSHNKPVSVNIESINQEVVITIKDQGVGIPENELPFIYDPFFRASNTHTFEGYGIGLPLSRNIILLHHGSLLVSSKANEGTTVRINFPVS